ncbi:regulatory ArsR family protein [Micromonospora pisi]|uniref:Regulatory ArsR family protein n=1 Tax=Micromonospora pisi TaxID=589240 RepID=A0A495JCA8_9ACTN|nr:winged helix-turn-helix domain-containing protein [Micromonospora pisi]RKR86361.1 regulatory ArsR family protein [Micromonospora pisi]
MSVWLIGADVLARSRFAVSPLIETVAALKALGGHGTHPGQRSWLEAHRPGYRARLAADPFAAAFVKVAFRPRWVADFVVTPPSQTDGGFAEEVGQVRATPPDVARADLATDWPGPLPPELRGDDVSERVADLFEWVWHGTVLPDWPRRRQLLEADIVSRTHQVSSGGWAAALDGMRKGMRWLDNGELQINGYDHPPRDLAGSRLLFIPTTSRRGWVGQGEQRYAVVYPCSGLLADPSIIAPPQALSALLGPVRAIILTQLESPKTTTQLVALTGYGLGSVGGHLRVLRDARLVWRRRSGRTVLYQRTGGGDQLVEMGAR